MKSLPNKNNVDQFIISDSTAPGSGALGIAHVFPRQQGSYNDLQNSMAGLINFGAFGIPNAGPNLCGYSPETADEELCARYFQLAVISPLAILSNNQPTLDFQPFNFSQKARDSIVNSLTQRLRFMMQMRSELYRVSVNGGALISPLFTQHQYTEWMQPANDLQSVMFGQSIRADLVFTQGTTQKEIRFQNGTKWLDLNTMETLVIPANPEFGIQYKAGIEDSVNLFQAQQTIVVMQDAKGVMRIEELKDVPLQLSVALGDASTATGSLYLEEGAASQFKTMSYLLSATATTITVLNETSRANISSSVSQIASITVTFLQQNQFVNASCAIMTDKQVLPLYVSSYNFAQRGQITITPQYLPDPGQPTYLDLNMLDKVRMGVAAAGNETSLCL